MHHFVIVSILFITSASAQVVSDELLASIRAEAARSHPSAEAAAYKAAAAQQEICVVRLWEDPTVGLSLMAAERAKREGDGDIILSLERALPKPGLYGASVEKARAQYRAEEQNSRLAQLQISSDSAHNLLELALADEAISLQRSQLVWLSEMTENAKELLLNPEASSADVLRLESEYAREREILEAAKRTRTGLSQKLNLKLGRDLDSRWSVLSLPTNPVSTPIASAEIARIPYMNPRVLAMKEMAGAAQAGVCIADRERQPGYALALGSELYSGGEFRDFTVGLRVSLPWFNDTSNNAIVAGAEKSAKAAHAETEVVRLEIAEHIIEAITEANNAAAQARAFSGEVYEKADAARKAIADSWLSSKSTLTALLDTNRSLFAIRLEQRRFIAMQLVALEKLHFYLPDPCSKE